MASNYSEKLKDPRWQKKRLEILERDEWTCQICLDSSSTLAVHHRKYLPDTEPWDYPSELLVTLCENCHENERVNRPQVEEMLLNILREKYFIDDIYNLVFALLGPFRTKNRCSYYTKELIGCLLLMGEDIRSKED